MNKDIINGLQIALDTIEAYVLNLGEHKELEEHFRSIYKIIEITKLNEMQEDVL